MTSSSSPARCPRSPSACAQLAPGGRLAAVVGKSPVMEAMLVRRLDGDNFNEVALFETDLPRLGNAKDPATFVF
jgi:protein-L-isoaspartate(D-aspartate) O-methyltransferase